MKLKILFLFLFLWHSSFICSSHDVSKPFVSCRLLGQLGNQMFAIATTMAYAWDHDAVALFPHLKDAETAYNCEHMFFRLDTSQAPRSFKSTFHESYWHSSNRIPFQEDLMLDGFFQSWRHFDHHRNKLLTLFAPSQVTREYLTNKYSELIDSPNTVAVHVRTFSLMRHNEKVHPFLGLEYYKGAFDLFPEDAVFVIFSDRIGWCKKHFSTMEKNFVFIEGNDAIQDLILMSMMSHNIIANSSMSWWGAYLNKNPCQKVIAPQSWMHPDYYVFPPPQPNDFYLPQWIVMPVNLEEPYPNDIANYDEKTQSRDEN